MSDPAIGLTRTDPEQTTTTTKEYPLQDPARPARKGQSKEEKRVAVLKETILSGRDYIDYLSADLGGEQKRDYCRQIKCLRHRKSTPAPSVKPLHRAVPDLRVAPHPKASPDHTIECPDSQPAGAQVPDPGQLP